MSEEIYIQLGGQTAGPYTMNQLRSMWSAGTLTAHTLHWREGMGEWLPLGGTLDGPTHAATPKAKVEDWSPLQFFVLVVLSLIIPLIGLLIGFVALFNPVKRQRGAVLIAFGVLSAAMTWYAFMVLGTR